jgi:ferric-dicitrate binding protein FerR (iron transport regulator)
MRDAPSRIERARRRAHGAKRALAIASAVAFLAGLALARVSHPGKAAAKTSGATASSSSSAATDGGSLTLGTGSIASGSDGTTTQTQTPTEEQGPAQVQTHVS